MLTSSPPTSAPGTDKTGMDFRRILPEIRCQSCLSPGSEPTPRGGFFDSVPGLPPPDDKIPLRTPNVRQHLRLTEVSPGPRPGVSACLALEPRLSRNGAHRRLSSAGHRTGAQ